MIAVGPAIPVSRRSQLGVPVGVQANLRLALAQGTSTSSTASSPGLPSLSYLALRDTDALAVATFASPNRLGYPPARAQREKLLARLDALVALSEDVRAAAELRFPGDYRVLSPGVDTTLFAPAAKERRSSSSCGRTSGWSHAASSTRSRPPRLGGRAPADAPADRPARDPARPRATRVHLRTARDAAARAATLNPAAIFVPGVEGLRRVTLEAAASGCAIARPRGSSQPELAAAAAARLAEDDALREREGAPLAPRPSSQTSPRSQASSTRSIAR